MNKDPQVLHNKLLREIKKLSEKYPGRVIYIPGNHDSFVVGYALGDNDSIKRLGYNGGNSTIKDLRELRKNNYQEYNELIT